MDHHPVKLQNYNTTTIAEFVLDYSYAYSYT